MAELIKCCSIENPRPSLDDGRLPILHWKEVLPAAWALAKIGKASVQPALQMAANPSATPAELVVAGKVLKEVEGDLAAVVVERFIAKSPDQALTKRMLERNYFVIQWKGPIDTKEPSKGK